MTVAKKMIFLVSAGLLGIVILAVVAQLQIQKVFEQTNYTNENVIPSLNLLSAIQNNVYRTRIRLNRHILNTDTSQSKKLEESMNDAISKAKADLKEYESLLADEKDKQLLKEDVEAFDRYLKHIPAIIAVSEKNQIEEARDLLELATPDAMAASAAIENHNLYNIELANNAKERALQTQRTAALISIVIASITLAAIAIIGFLITRNLLKQLGGEPDYAAAVVSRIAKGDLSQEVKVKTGDSTSMLASIREMSQTLSQILSDVRSSADALASRRKKSMQLRNPWQKVRQYKRPALKKPLRQWKKCLHPLCKIMKTPV